MKEWFPKSGELSGFWRSLDIVVPRTASLRDTMLLSIYDNIAIGSTAMALISAAQGDVEVAVVGIVGLGGGALGGLIHRGDIRERV